MVISKLANRVQRTYLNATDRLVPYCRSRWAVAISLILLYF